MAGRCDIGGLGELEGRIDPTTPPRPDTATATSHTGSQDLSVVLRALGRQVLPHSFSMLKHCHNSSIRLQRRCNSGNMMSNPDTLSINSTVTIQSSCGSSESNTSDSLLNSSFNINSDDRECFTNVRNAIFDRSAYSSITPDPISLSSRASSYVSLSEPGPKSTIKVYASCLRPDIEYKTLSIGNNTGAKTVIWQLLSKYKMKHRDPKLFFLTLEVVIQKPGRDGLTKKTLVLEDDSKPVELKNCNPWGECRFTLQMKKGGLVRVHDSILMEESQYKCLFISEETSVEEVIKILLHCYGLEKVERAERYCLYEQSVTQRYQRKLRQDQKPLQIQSLWPADQTGPGNFSFVLKQNFARSFEDNMWPQHQHEQVSDKTDERNEPRRVIADSRNKVSDGSWAELVSEWASSMQGPPDTNNYNSAPLDTNNYNRQTPPDTNNYNKQAPPDTNNYNSDSPNMRNCESDEFIRVSPWPELDKDTEEHVSGSEDMDTSLSSHDSPTPPITSTPLSDPASRLHGTHSNLPKPTMSFLFPSPDYASFPNSFVPSRPYSSLSNSGSSLSLCSTKISVAPILPPKPASLVSLFAKTNSASTFHDYENYFYI